VKYDEQYRTALVQTLETYLSCDGSVSIAATRLHAHRHTVRYRIGRIRELTGHDVTTQQGRERLAFGLRAMRVLASDDGKVHPPV
jgi:DNA-binding PucR family transcriptional regulator